MSKNMVLPPKYYIILPWHMSKNMVLPPKYYIIVMEHFQKHGITPKILYNSYGTAPKIL